MSHAFLSALDAMFLAIEDECNHMHVALTCVFEKRPLQNDQGLLDMDRIRRYAEQVLASLPKFRQRLAWTDWLRHPVLVDDTRFDLNAHLRYVALDAPGGDADLKALMGRLYSRPLDRTRPLWEQWYVDGLAGDRFAVVTKAHHCLVDGVAGIGALTAMLRADDDATIRGAPPWQPEPLPTGRALLKEEITHRLREPSALVDVVRRRLESKLRHERRSFVDLARAGTAAMVRTILPSTRTRLNPKRIGSARHFEWVRIDFGRARAIKRRAAGKINDVVLACVTGAVRRYLLQHGDDVRKMRFRALIPVSLHDADRNVIHNEVSLMIAALPVSEPDPRRRLETIVAETQAAKSSGQSDVLGLAGVAADVAARGAIAAGAKAMIRLLPFNVVVTNIPGPPFPLYLLGARMLAAYPMVPLYMNQAVGVAVVSYDGALYFGLNADAAHVPDVSALAHALEASVAELEEAYGLSAPARSG